MPTDDRTYIDKVVRVTELVAVDGVLEGFRFEGCHIDGPAVLVLGDTVLAHNDLGGPDLSAVLWEIPPSRPVVVGAIHARNCTFERCTFRNVGFAGPPELIAKFG